MNMIIQMLGLAASIWTLVPAGVSLLKFLSVGRLGSFKLVRRERLQHLEACEEALRTLVQQAESARGAMECNKATKMQR